MSVSRITEDDVETTEAQAVAGDTADDGTTTAPSGANVASAEGDEDTDE